MSTKRSRTTFESDPSPPAHAPYALVGTPLPAYTPNTRDDGSFVPEWQQTVTDERGRKRLHGAFTGGWSAGYFNSVGSKEGWTPATFVSSRNKRADKVETRAEDVMDDEDLAEAEEKRKLVTSGSFAGLGEQERGKGGEDTGQKGMFADLFRTTGETMGVKLLQRMGWRPGQGVGPKVKRKAKGDEKGQAHLFAPENTRMIAFQRKTDRKGLGYRGGERLDNGRDSKNEDGEGSDEDARILQAGRSKLLAKPKKIKKSGLGVGVLNDTGSDDEDPYTMGPQINYSRIIGGDKKKKRGGLTASTNTTRNPTSQKLAQRTTALSGFRKCHDGCLPLHGFILATAALTLDPATTYPPPIVPDDWKPSRLEVHPSPPNNPTYQSPADAAKASTLTPSTRASLLGEQQLPGKSVFSFLTPSARAKLAAASGKTDLPPALSEGAPPKHPSTTSPTHHQQRNLWDLVPSLSRETAIAALSRSYDSGGGGSGGWLPYADDPGKRDRYTKFLRLHAGHETSSSSTALPPRAPGQSVSEWTQELREFAHAAEVFRPISGIMASRFTSSTSSSESPSRVADANSGDSSSHQPTHSTAKPEDPAEKAAKMGMHGPLTRSRHPFFPTRLLCKRFGVRAPSTVVSQYHDEGAASGPERSSRGGGGGGGGGGEGGVGKKEMVSHAILEQTLRESRGNFVSAGPAELPVDHAEEAKVTEERKAVRSKEETEVLPEVNPALEARRAGEEVFRAIFGSDSEDE